jgi:hypothetical protein
VSGVRGENREECERVLAFRVVVVSGERGENREEGEGRCRRRTTRIRNSQ